MKMMKKLVAALALAGCAGTLHAQDGPARPPSAPVQAPAVAGVLTDAGLKDMLEAIGYETRAEKSGDSMLYYVKVKAEGLQYEVSFQVSPNKEKVWLIVSLADVTPEHKKDAALWFKLTELNDDIGPCYFRYNEANKRLYMARPFDNRAVTAKVLRDNLERLTDRCVETKAHWTAFSRAASPRGTAAAPTK